MNFTHTIGRLLGFENVTSIDEITPSFGAPWANARPFLVFLGCVALAVLSFWFYAKYQSHKRSKVRLALAAMRALLLCLLWIILADPGLTVKLTSNPRPLLFVLFDGTDSMAIEDEWTDDQAAELADAAGLSKDATAEEDSKLSRIGYVQALIKNEEQSPLAELNEKFRVRAFLLDRPDGVRSLKLNEAAEGEADPDLLAEQLTTTGQVTALGKAFDDLALRHSTGQLAGLVVFSDFAQNSGPAPIGSTTAPVGKLGVPIYTVGIGPEAAADLSVAISTPPLMKKAERDVITVTLRNMQLAGRMVTVRVLDRRIDTEGDLQATPELIPGGEKEVELGSLTTTVEFPFTPEETGRFEFIAEVEPFEEEVVDQNNRASRDVSIRDDFLRLMYVAYEPTWEWRFIKEVFHRDKLVGLRGFRTFLRSSDPKVRRTNPLFMPTLTPRRSEFFANDVLFLGDMPDSALSTRFAEMTREYVSKFGGGLVVIAGPRFGPAHLSNTPLADMLPVVIDSGAQIRDSQEFRMQLAPGAVGYDFMNLGETPEENAKAWENVGQLPWYQPVAKPHPQATVLAQHPYDKCVDGKTPQPLIAIRQYGKGEVIYLGFNETWRLRRKYGELYYRQFWGQMIYHLGLRHALGSQKRFVVETDRPQYRADDQVTLTVEAYDENFQPLGEDKLPDRKLIGELFTPEGDDNASGSQPISIPFSRDGVFEARIPVFEGGEHRVRVRDPITKQFSEVIFQVADVSAERQSAVRNVALQREIAQTSGGKSYELASLKSLAADVNLPKITESSIEVIRLWSTWLCFCLVVLLMLSEWLVRKWVNLP